MNSKINNDFNYDIVYIGSGPSTIFSLLELIIKKNYKGKILVLEQGDKLPTRKDICSGFAGAGCMSDGKLVCHYSVGGDLSDILSIKEFYKYGDRVLNLINEFIEPSQKRSWVQGAPYPHKIPLDFIQSKVCHLGTENTQRIFHTIQKFLLKQKNVKMKFNTPVLEIKKIENNTFKIITNKHIYKASKLVIATGSRDKLLPSLISDLNIKSVNRPVQIGIRVESSNKDRRWDEILKLNYDFKFVLKNKLTTVRTFCCNSVAAYIAKEKNNGQFISYNGHAYKDLSKANDKVNFGIMCETNLPSFSKDKQIKWCKDVNRALPYSPYKLEKLEIIKYHFPAKIGKAIENFVKKLNKIVDLSGAKFYIPEIKLRGVKLNIDKKMQIAPNLHVIGDLAISRGIVQAGISGILLSESLYKDHKKIN